jgi:two-component system response regulator YesN
MNNLNLGGSQSMFRILLVDDQPIEIETIRMLINQYQLPLEVADARNGEEALQFLKENPIDILFTDIRMPFMDGLELSRNALALYPSLKVIIYSAYSEFEYAKQAIKLRVFDYTLKPIEVDPFLEVMRAVIAECESEQLNSTLLWEENKGDRGDHNRKVIDEIIQMVSQNYGFELSVEYLAQKVFLSPNYLSALFKKETGQSLNKFITQTRLDTAKSLLINTNMRIVDISTQVGYANPSYFAVLFKTNFGLSPAQFRERS